MQLTVATYGEAVSELTRVVSKSEDSDEQQTSENLGSVAKYFQNLASFVTKLENIDERVSFETANVYYTMHALI